MVLFSEVSAVLFALVMEFLHSRYLCQEVGLHLVVVLHLGVQDILAEHILLVQDVLNNLGLHSIQCDDYDNSVVLQALEEVVCMLKAEIRTLLEA